MKRCRNCTWREPKTPEFGRNMGKNGSFCRSPHHYTEGSKGDPSEEYQTNHLVHAHDKWAAFWVGDDYGCVHHTTRPDPQVNAEVPTAQQPTPNRWEGLELEEDY